MVTKQRSACKELPERALKAIRKGKKDKTMKNDLEGAR
jgi:hypothetical protein